MVLGYSVADASGLILAVDEPVANLLWRSRAEMVGMSYLELTHADDRDLNRLKVSRLSGADGPISIRKRYLRSDGSSILVDLEVSRLDLGPEAGQLIGGFRLPVAAEAGAEPRRLWHTARFLTLFDQLRRERLGDMAFGDTVWSILVQTYLAEAEGRIIDDAELSDATGLPMPLLRRWIGVLQGRGLIDPDVGAGGPRQLTKEGLSAVEGVFIRLDEAFAR